MITWRDACREPFRVLFPLGILFGCIGISHWLLYALQWSTSSSSFYHASLQVFTYMYCFIAGFLMTALPRFAAAPPATSVELGGLLILLAVELVTLSLSWWEAASTAVVILLAWLGLFASRRFAHRRVSGVSPPTEFVWIPMALLLGIIGSLAVLLGLFEVAPWWLLGMGRPMAQQGFLLGIVLGVGGFMAPRLMGTGRTLRVAAAERPPHQIRAVRARRVTLHGGAALLLVASFWVEGWGAIQPAYLLRAGVVTAELVWTTRCDRLPATSDGYVRLLWVSLWMVMLGLWGAVCLPGHRVAALHLTFLGGFSLMTFAVGTMVVLSHAGEGHRLQQPLWVLRVVAIGIGIAVMSRLGAHAVPSAYFALVGIASAAWLAAGVSWLVFIWSHVVRVPPQGTFDRVHDEAKRRLLRTT